VIEFREAIKLMLNHVRIMNKIKLSLLNSLNYVLAEDIYATIDLPPFDNSAVDGYALKSQDIINANEKNPITLKLVERIRAGDLPRFEIKSGSASKVMTGAMIPIGADSVCMQEFAKEEDGYVKIYKNTQLGENIRKRGEEIKKGEVAINKNKLITPSIIGLLAKLGYTEVTVYSKPKIGILVTGKELIEPGNELQQGKIWEANSYSLASSLKYDGFPFEKLGIIKDDPETFRNKINHNADNFDVFIISGGTSEGEEDFVKRELEILGVKRVFWKVNIKPGKPFYFGIKDDKLFFALPGNPASAMVCYYQFIRPALMKMIGREDIFLPERYAELQEEIKRKAGRIEFIRGYAYWHESQYFARSTGLQESHALKSFAEANCFIVVEEKEKEFLKKGEIVKIQLLPWFNV